MATDFQAVVRLPYTTGFPQDVAVNTFAFNTASSQTAADVSGYWSSRIAAFYNAGSGGSTTTIANYIGVTVSRAANACSISWHEIDLATGTTGDPLVVYPFTLGAPQAVNSAPLEVALCLSMRNTANSTFPLARRTGRIYIGPLITAAINLTASGLPVPNTLLINAMAYNAASLASGSFGGGLWSVWSRASETLFPISGGWVDNEFDTQRRRQVDATARVAWSRTV